VHVRVNTLDLSLGSFSRYFLFTHIDFDIKYNGDNVIEINVSTDPQQAVDISDGVGEVQVKFTYSVRWTPTTTTYDKRLQRYERFPLNPVHLEVCACVCSPGNLSQHCQQAAAVQPMPFPCGLLPMQIHWFSIINSCVTVLLLTGFLATILMRVLKADFLKYSRDDRECFQPTALHVLKLDQATAME
jgi:metal-sulfur cluster biosynthetic enzyme